MIKIETIQQLETQGIVFTWYQVPIRKYFTINYKIIVLKIRNKTRIPNCIWHDSGGPSQYENNQYFRGKDNGKCACGWDIRVLTEVSEKWFQDSRIPRFLEIHSFLILVSFVLFKIHSDISPKKKMLYHRQIIYFVPNPFRT